MVVSVEGAGGARVPWLWAGTEGHREVESEVDGVADLLGGASRQLEQVLVVREDVVEGGIALVSGILARFNQIKQIFISMFSILEHQAKVELVNSSWIIGQNIPDH